MDPISQATFGALFAQTSGKTKNLAAASIVGALAGLAPDMDIFIRSQEDSLLALEYHRHFTHSLFFIPFGGLICSLIAYPIFAKRWNIKFFQILLWCLLGFASHGLVDSLTSYGTQLFWPFNNYRISWDVVSIIDPLLTLPLLTFVILAAFKKNNRYVIFGVAWATLYLSVSLFQQQRVLNEGTILAQKRGLTITQIEAKPSFANILVWKVITTTKDSYYVDAVKVGWGDPIIWQGDTIQKLSIPRDLPWLDKKSQQRKDIERFRWFSGGYIALDKTNSHRVIDIRYSLLPQEIKPLWGIELSTNGDLEQHAEFYNERGNAKGAFKKLWQMITQ